MQVLIPAGGRGTRLRPLTDDRPKPLLPLGDQPILSRILGRIPREVPVTVLVTEALAPAFRRWRAMHHADRDVRIHVEQERASGPSGPVVALAECIAERGIREEIVVMMGDSVHPFHWEEFLADGLTQRPRVAAYRLPDIRDAARFGVVEIAPNGTLAGFEEKPSQPRSPWIFTGCLYLPALYLEAVREIARRQVPQMGHLVEALLKRGETVSVYPVTGEWHDIGTYQSYLEAHRSHMSRAEAERLRSQGNRLEGVVYVHPAARVSGSVLRNCVVFADSEVRGAELTDCVVQSDVVLADRVVQGKLIARDRELALAAGVMNG
jgi:NDP-sugar pyrophosphorylase family protein